MARCAERAGVRAAASTGTSSSGASPRATAPTSGRSSGARSNELIDYYEQCRQARDLPSIPGAVIISSDEKLSFSPLDERQRVGILHVPEREGILRAIDGQHRLLALHADLERFGEEEFAVPAVIFDQLPEDHVVQMFVTINAKHTRLNASHLVSLCGPPALQGREPRGRPRRRPDPERPGGFARSSGRSSCSASARAASRRRRWRRNSSASSRRSAFGGPRRSANFRDESAHFFVNYFKQVAQVFTAAWNGRKYWIKSAPALRAFIRVAPDVVRRLDQEHAERTDARAIRRVIAPWGHRIGDARFETDAAWQHGATTVDGLARDLRLALQYPEGAGL